MLIKKICILGGTGFVGKVLANRLVDRGYSLRILTRDREANKDNLILLPATDLVETNIHDPENLKQQFAGCDAVINLIGILNERSGNGSGFHAVHVTLTEKIIEACRANGIRRLLHMSALNADAAKGPSHYLRTKGEGEDRAHAAKGIHVTSYRPSVIFGDGDSFFNRFADLLRLSPGVLPLACPKARFAPVFVGDVAEAMCETMTDPDYYGRRLELCGPESYTLEDLVRYTVTCIGKRRLIIPLPDIMSRLQGAFFDFAGFAFNILGVEKPFSTDNYLSTKIDSVCSCNSLPDLGIRPLALEAVVPQYLTGRTYRTDYYEFRRHSHR
ncbi:MAG: complex I NDUFA9 subunit family protein [Gammaproteobacteria bacterium]